MSSRSLTRSDSFETPSEHERRLLLEASEAGDPGPGTSEGVRALLFAPGTAAAARLERRGSLVGGTLWNQPRHRPIKRASLDLKRPKTTHGAAGQPARSRCSIDMAAAHGPLHPLSTEFSYSSGGSGPVIESKQFMAGCGPHPISTLDHISQLTWHF